MKTPSPVRPGLILIALAILLAVAVLPGPSTALASEPQQAAGPTPVNISNSSTDSTFEYPGNGNVHSMGVDQNGKAYVIWYEWQNPRRFYFATNKSGAWSTPAAIERLNWEHPESGYPVMAVSPAGNVHLMFHDGRDQMIDADIFHLAYNGSSWSHTTNVSGIATGSSVYGGVAVSPVDGTALVIWGENRADEPGEWLLIQRSRSASGVWSGVQVLHDSSPLLWGYFPRLVIDPKGTAHMVYGYAHTSTLWYTKNATPTNPAGWTTPVRVRDTGFDWSFFSVACDNAGNAYVVWDDATTGNEEIFIRTIAANGAMGTAVNVSNSPSAVSSEPTLGVNQATGDILVAWTEKDNIFVNARLNGAWTGPANATNSSHDCMQPAVAVDPSGAAHLVYASKVSGNWEIMYMTLAAGAGSSRSVDFNGDGQEDLLWRYYGSGGDNVVWYLGTSGADSPAQASDLRTKTGLKNATPAVVFADAREAGDGSGPERSFLDPREVESRSLRNVLTPRSLANPRQIGVAPLTREASGSLEARLMDSVRSGISANLQSSMKIIGGGVLPSVADLNWQIAGTGDFNADGQVDVLWRYTGTGGYNCLWYMNGTTVQAGVDLPSVGDLNWQVQGTGDFNGDGKTDILWRYNGAVGHNCVWYMNGAKVLGGADLPAVADLSWQIQGTGDFNGDGKTDILWRNSGSGGYNCVWYMNGAAVLGGADLPAVADSNWRIQGTGDFDGDGDVDIVWRYFGGGGYNFLWYMNGTRVTGGSELPSETALSWKIVNR